MSVLPCFSLPEVGVPTYRFLGLQMLPWLAQKWCPLWCTVSRLPTPTANSWTHVSTPSKTPRQVPNLAATRSILFNDTPNFLAKLSISTANLDAWQQNHCWRDCGLSTKRTLQFPQPDHQPDYCFSSARLLSYLSSLPTGLHQAGLQCRGHWTQGSKTISANV